jgi:8-hydroxy-5-deazaflavin:NADPH oxidoreductase
MKIGIIGTGNMARSLGILWAEQGHEVFFGSRNAEKGRSVAQVAANEAKSGTNDEAAEFGEVIFYSVRDIMPSKIFSEPKVLNSKIVIDCNNRAIPENYDFNPLLDESLAEKLAADIPNAHVVKAFNTMAQEIFELSPQPLKDYNVSCFICGDNEQAKQTVMSLAQEIGFAPINCGALYRARLVEALGDFIRYAMGGMELGAYATISIHKLPEAQKQRLGGRQPSNLK